MTSIVVATESEIVNAYGVDMAGLLAKKAEYLSLEFDTPANYRESSKSLAVVRYTDIGIEKRRKELKANSLEYGRLVDSVAHRLSAPIKEIRDAMEVKKKAADDAKAAEKAKKEATAVEALAVKVRAEQEAREAQLKAERESFEEEKRLAKIESDRIATERAKLEAEQEATRKATAEKQAELDAAQLRAEQIERDRLAKIEAERVATERAKQAVIDAENARVAELERVARLKAREEAARPDKEKLRVFEAKILELAKSDPEVSDTEAMIALEQCIRSLGIAREYLQDYVGDGVQSKAAE